MPDQERSHFSLAALLYNRVTRILAILGALFVIYIEGATAFVGTQKAIEAKAIADNAALKQKSEGELAAQQATTALETARNAAQRQRAEAEKAEADANKAEAEAITAREIARNAERKARADAETIKAEAELRKQKYIVAIETARNSARKQKADADRIEAELVGKQQAAAILARQVELTDCSKRFRARDMGEDFNRRFHCGR